MSIGSRLGTTIVAGGLQARKAIHLTIHTSEVSHDTPFDSQSRLFSARSRNILGRRLRMHYTGITGRGDVQGEPSGRVQPQGLPQQGATPHTGSFKSDAEAVERLLQCPLTKVGTTIHTSYSMPKQRSKQCCAHSW